VPPSHCRSGDDLAASLSNFSPREWGLDLAEPMPGYVLSPPGPNSAAAAGAAGRGADGFRSPTGLSPRQAEDRRHGSGQHGGGGGGGAELDGCGPMDLSLQRGQVQWLSTWNHGSMVVS